MLCTRLPKLSPLFREVHVVDGACIGLCVRSRLYRCCVLCTDAMQRSGNDFLSCLGNTTNKGGVHSATADGIIRCARGMGKGGPLDDFLAVVVDAVRRGIACLLDLAALGTDDRGDAKVFGS